MLTAIFQKVDIRFLRFSQLSVKPNFQCGKSVQAVSALLGGVGAITHEMRTAMLSSGLYPISEEVFRDVVAARAIRCVFHSATACDPGDGTEPIILITGVGRLRNMAVQLVEHVRADEDINAKSFLTGLE